MNFEFKGQTALVTGASQGIGRAIARGLAAQGVRVAVAARRRPLLDQLMDEIAHSADVRPVVIEAIIGLAHTLGLSVTAEGVETDAQLVYLRSVGCQRAQGFLISKPVEAAAAAAWLSPSAASNRTCRDT